MQIQQTTNSVNNFYLSQNIKVNKKTFDPFVPENSVYPKIPINATKAYAAPQIYPEYKVLETFKLPNTGVGKVYQLRNGHKVLVLPKKGPTFINTGIGAGEVNLPADKKSAAHLLEHLLSTITYKNDKEVLNNISDEINMDSNASTSLFSTNYFGEAFVSDDNDLEKLIRLQFSTVAKPDFTLKDIEHEKATIYQEMLERYDSYENFALANIRSRYLLNIDENSSLLDKKDASAIKNITKEDLQTFYQQYYRPDNMYTVIVGNVDENTIKIIAKYFNQQKNPVTSIKRTEEQHLFDNPIQKAVRVNTVSTNKYKEDCSINLDFFVDKTNNPDADIQLNIIKKLLLNKWQGNRDDIIIANYNYTSSHPEKSDFGLSIPSKKEDVEQNIQSTYKTLNDIQNNPVTEQELNDAKEFVKNNLTSEYAEILANMYTSKLIYSKPVNYESIIKTIDKITARDVCDAAKKYLNLDKVLLTVVYPQEKHKEPSFKGQLKIQDMLNIKEYTLPNNVNVVINESDSVSNATIDFKLNAVEQNSAHSEAVKYLINTIENSDFENYCNANDITIDKLINRQQIELILNSTPKKTIDMLLMLIKIIFYPDLNNQQDFEKWKQNNSDTNNKTLSLYQKYINEFFRDTPWLYEHDNINDLKIQDVQNLHKNIINNAQASVLITIPKSESEKYRQNILNILSNLKSFKPFNYSHYFNTYKAAPLTKSKLFVEKNSDNTIYMEKSYKIIKSGNIKDYAGLNILKCIIGDGDKSILFNKLRTEKNLVYSVNAKYPEEFYAPNLGKMIFSTTVSAENKNYIKDVLQEFQTTTEKLQSELVDERTLALAKKKFKCMMLSQSSFGQNKRLAMVKDSFYGADYFKELDSVIDEITPQDIRELAKYYFSQPSLYMISGNKDAIEANMDYLKNLGEICC